MHQFLQSTHQNYLNTCFDSIRVSSLKTLQGIIIFQIILKSRLSDKSKQYIFSLSIDLGKS